MFLPSYIFFSKIVHEYSLSPNKDACRIPVFPILWKLVLCYLSHDHFISLKAFGLAMSKAFQEFRKTAETKSPPFNWLRTINITGFTKQDFYKIHFEPFILIIFKPISTNSFLSLQFLLISTQNNRTRGVQFQEKSINNSLRKRIIFPALVRSIKAA